MKRLAIICDIDGTIAEAKHRNIFDDMKCESDEPKTDIIGAVKVMFAGLCAYCRKNESFYIQPPPKLIFVSGRKDRCMEQTRRWLDRHFAMSEEWPYDLFMRETSDNRKDSIVKKEIYDKYISPEYDVFCVFDDRNQVVDMWRNELGLTCLQVADGNF